MNHNVRPCADRRLVRAGRRLLATSLLALAACLPPACLAARAGAGAEAEAEAAAAEDVGTIIVRGMLSDHNPFMPGARRGRFPATIFLQGERLRVDFAGPAGERGALLFDRGTGQGWLVHLDQQVALPVDASAVRSVNPLRVDAADPCARLRPHCGPTGSRFIAGQARKGYRYRSAAGRGPGGTSDGEFWVDGPLGVLVAYRGTGRSGRDAPAMEADFLLVDEIEPAYFELPSTVTAYQGRTPRGDGAPR